MAREDLHFRLRIPENLKEKVSAAAVKNDRSMTAEIVDRLERSFLNWPDLDIDPLLYFKVLKLPQGAIRALEWEIQRQVSQMMLKVVTEHEISRSSIRHSMLEALKSEPEELRPKLMEHMEGLLKRMGLGSLDVDLGDDTSEFEEE